jgi:phenylacetate-coenzyme A ligase PaaK-like adenylate-forming protein
MDRHLAGLLQAEQYSLPATEKEPLLMTGLNELTAHHAERSREYARILQATGAALLAERVEDVPYLPVSLFKSVELRSIAQEETFKVMTSSGTTGQVPSRVYLDVETARLQTLALASIVTHYLGPHRRPMLIVDHRGAVTDRRSFSARGAGILGMLNFGRDHHYALDEEMRLDRPALEGWLSRHAGEDLLVFGFTFIVWNDLLEPLRDAGLDLSRAVLVHSGGWKKLVDMAVTGEVFRRDLREAFGIERVHDFYGMVEQVGSVFFACPEGWFHPPNFGDVIVRDPATWEPAPDGSPGVVEAISLLPRSYPGHALLTEDLAVVHGVDDCPCGRRGRWFEVLGRVPKAEIRGCSDTVTRA